jgi:hypothetical protein
MSYKVRDPDNIKSWYVFFSLTTGERCRVQKAWLKKEDAEREAIKLPEGKIKPIFGWKTIETVYPTCPKCGRQGESKNIRDYNYNGGGEYFRCLNPECKHEWCWS